MDNSTDRLLPRDAAQYLRERFGVRTSPAHLNSMRYLGRGPTFIKLGKWVVYERADLDAWVQAKTVRVERELA